LFGLTCRRSCRAAATAPTPAIDIIPLASKPESWRARSLSKGPTLPVTRKCPASSSSSARQSRTNLVAFVAETRIPLPVLRLPQCHWQSATGTMDSKVSPGCQCTPFGHPHPRRRPPHWQVPQCVHVQVPVPRRSVRCPAAPGPRGTSVTVTGPWLSPGLATHCHCGSEYPSPWAKETLKRRTIMARDSSCSYSRGVQTERLLIRRE
jgi:hypothetical protein